MAATDTNRKIVLRPFNENLVTFLHPNPPILVSVISINLHVPLNATSRGSFITNALCISYERPPSIKVHDQFCIFVTLLFEISHCTLCRLGERI